ncbi:MAG: hypothetical protein U0531_14525 [Dehalococcoidia bacterium]
MIDKGVHMAGSAQSTSDLTKEDYARFIGSLELVSIWLNDARIENHVGPETPERVVLSVDTEAEWRPYADGFRVMHRYRTQFRAADGMPALIEVTFGVQFRSTLPMTDEVFEVFREVNLPVNTWPYLREFISGSLGRMNWTPYALPALKRGAATALPDVQDTAPRSRRRRASSPALGPPAEIGAGAA